MGWFAGSAPVAAIHRFPLSCNPRRFGEKIFPPRFCLQPTPAATPCVVLVGARPARCPFPRRLQKSSFWGLKHSQTRGTLPESEPGAARGLEEAGDQGTTQPTSAHENCSLGSKSLPAPRPSTDLSCSAPTHFQIFKAELLSPPHKSHFHQCL